MKTDREKEQLARNVEKLGSVVLDSLDREVGKTYDNQRRLEGEAKELEAKVVAFSKDIKRKRRHLSKHVDTSSWPEIKKHNVVTVRV